MDGIVYLALYLIAANVVLTIWKPLCVMCAISLLLAVALRQRG
jgi:hypothetical protein